MILKIKGVSVVRKIIDKYGLINVIISLICCVVFILNCLFITKASLININENITIAWLLNFFGGVRAFLANGVVCHTLPLLKNYNCGD